MAEQITAQDVRDNYPGLTGSVSDVLINGMISKINGADDCLDAYGVPSDQQTLLKLTGVAYLLEQALGSSTVASERSANGSSVSYKDGETSANYALLQTIDTNRCILNQLSAAGADIFIGVSNGSH